MSSRSFEAVLQSMLTLMYFILLALMFPAMVYVTSGGTLDMLTAIPNGYQIWHISSYVAPVVTLTLIVTLFIHRRAERSRSKHAQHYARAEFMEAVRQRQAERDQH